ncbi:unnamed protein product [Caenorhabditis angaria]|uniref:Uncharacterized protein n=1 Tax=Caenorhabditis angaria TaxID=860376 RepID=A0A9P1ND47_9PELO|nr:unnamed protein product [Caenorhabditis angaria]
MSPDQMRLYRKIQATQRGVQIDVEKMLSKETTAINCRRIKCAFKMDLLIVQSDCPAVVEGNHRIIGIPTTNKA